MEFAALLLLAAAGTLACAGAAVAFTYAMIRYIKAG